MALKMRLRPQERLAINGAVIRNPGGRAIEIEVLNEATLFHERDIMMPEQATTPLKQLYFLIQGLHLEPGDERAQHEAFIKAASEVFAQAYANSDLETCSLVNELVLVVGEKNHIKALRLLQSSFGRPGDERRLENDG